MNGMASIALCSANRMEFIPSASDQDHLMYTPAPAYLLSEPSVAMMRSSSVTFCEFMYVCSSSLERTMMCGNGRGFLNMDCFLAGLLEEGRMYALRHMLMYLAISAVSS